MYIPVTDLALCMHCTNVAKQPFTHHSNVVKLFTMEWKKIVQHGYNLKPKCPHIRLLKQQQKLVI